MLTFESILAIGKEALGEEAGNLSRSDISQLVEWLKEKDDRVRYQAFLLLSRRSASSGDLYPYWETFRGKLKNDNSYQRSLALMLLAENAKWDTQNRMEKTIDEYLELLHDEKPITVRQCIQSLEKIARHKPGLQGRIAERLLALDLTAAPETMRKSILTDILHLLFAIRGQFKTDETEGFILKALSGEVLDKKSKKQFEALL